MNLLTIDGKQAVIKVSHSTSRKTGRTVWFYQTEDGWNYISKKKLPNNADVRKALTDAFG